MHIENDVLFGLDGWKFLYSGSHDQFDYLLGDKSVPDSSIRKFHENVDNRSDFCSSRNIAFKHVVFPCKPVSCLNKLPSELGDVQSLFSRRHMCESVIYPIDESGLDGAFYKTDTHLTSFGGWAVLNRLLLELGVNFNVSPIFRDSKFNGDLNVMLGVKDPEECIVFSGLEGVRSKKLDVNNNSGLVGNTGRVRILRNPFSISEKRVLIFGDSFFNTSISEQLAFLFRDVIYFRSPVFLFDIVDYISPDIIFSGQAERYLSDVREDGSASFPLSAYLDPSFYKAPSVDESFTKALVAQLSFSRAKNYYNSWTNETDAKLYRDLAIRFEREDIDFSYSMMMHAKELKPKGYSINRKVQEYERLRRVHV